jgi:D-alanine-D-alanine ligase
MCTDVCIVYNEPLPGAFDDAGESIAVASVLDAVSAVTEALHEKGYSYHLLPVSPGGCNDMLRRLSRLNPRVIFNLFEGFDRAPESEGMVAALLEKTGIPVTGAPSRALAACIDKAKTKSRLRSLALPTADWHLYESGAPLQPPSAGLRFPCVVKPLATDASHGLTERSLVKSFHEMFEQVAQVHSRYGQAALVEEFLPGREFNILVMGPPLRHFSIAEILFSLPAGKPQLCTYASKWEEGDEYYAATQVQCPAQLSAAEARVIENLAARAFDGLVGRGYARIDLRADRSGAITILEINPNPDIGPASGAKKEAEAAGMSYHDFLCEIMAQAWSGRGCFQCSALPSLS